MRTRLRSGLRLAVLATSMSMAIWGAGSPVRADEPAQASFVGQVVCSACWAEQDDRVAHPYGTDADLKCAARCAKRNVGQSLAVWKDGHAELIVLEKGEVALDGKDFLAFVAKEVEVGGTLRVDAGKRILKVDRIRVTAERPSKP